MPACECALCVFLSAYLYIALWLYHAYLKMCTFACVCMCVHMYMCAYLQTVRDFSKGVSLCDDGEGGPFVFSHSATRTLSHM